MHSRPGLHRTASVLGARGRRGHPAAIAASSGNLHVDGKASLYRTCFAIYTWMAKQVRYKLGTRRLVDEINSRIMSRCVKEFVSWKGIVRAEWFVNSQTPSD